MRGSQAGNRGGFDFSCCCNLERLDDKSPLVGGFSDGLEHVVFRFPEGFDLVPVRDLADTPRMRSANLINDTADAAPLPPAKVLSRMVQDVMPWTPNTEWGGGYGPNRDGTYLTIGAYEKPALEGPRYFYGAMDSEELLAAAEGREILRRMAEGGV